MIRLAQDSFQVSFWSCNWMQLEFLYQNVQYIIGEEFRQGWADVDVADTQCQQC